MPKHDVYTSKVRVIYRIVQLAITVLPVWIQKFNKSFENYYPSDRLHENSKAALIDCYVRLYYGAHLQITRILHLHFVSACSARNSSVKRVFRLKYIISAGVQKFCTAIKIEFNAMRRGEGKNY